MKKIDCVLIKNGNAAIVSVDDDFRSIAAVLGVDYVEYPVRYVDGKPYVFCCDEEGAVNGKYFVEDSAAYSAETDYAGNPQEIILGPVLICRPLIGGSGLRSLTRRDQEDLVGFHDVGDAIIYRLRPSQRASMRKGGAGTPLPASPDPREEGGRRHG